MTSEKIAGDSKKMVGIKNMPNPSIILLNLHLICLTFYYQENFWIKIVFRQSTDITKML